MNPAVDVSWHPNHFLSDRIMSPLCSALSWPRASRWCSKTHSEWQFTVRGGLGQGVHGKQTQRHGLHEFCMILNLIDWCGTVCEHTRYKQMLLDSTRHFIWLSCLNCRLRNCKLMSWSTYQLSLYPLSPAWSLKAACCLNQKDDFITFLQFLDHKLVSCCENMAPVCLSGLDGLPCVTWSLGICTGYHSHV